MTDPRAFTLGQLDRLMGFFPRVEGKASFLMVLNVALLGVAAINYPVRDVVSPRGIAGIAAFVFLGLSLLHVYKVFFPHLNPAPTESITFFGDIAKGTAGEYKKRVIAISEDEFLDDMACQIWRNSEILKIKFDHVRVAFIFAGLSLPPWAVLLSAVALRAGKITVSS